ncbi:hypothetical protein IAT40_004528 [Kwoniella sp. CBS 6097]
MGSIWDHLSRAQYGFPLHPAFGSPHEGFRERHNDDDSQPHPEQPDNPSNDHAEDQPNGGPQESLIEAEKEEEVAPRPALSVISSEADETVDIADATPSRAYSINTDQTAPPSMAESSTRAGSSAAGPSGTSGNGDPTETTNSTPGPGPAGPGSATTDTEGQSHPEVPNPSRDADQSSFAPGDDDEYTVRGEKRNVPDPGEEWNSDSSYGWRGLYDRIRRTGRSRTQTTRANDGKPDRNVTFDAMRDSDEDLRERIPLASRRRGRRRTTNRSPDTSSPDSSPSDGEVGGDGVTRSTAHTASRTRMTTEEDKVRAYWARREKAMQTEGSNPEYIEPHPHSSVFKPKGESIPRERLTKRHPGSYQPYVSTEAEEARNTIDGTGIAPASSAGVTTEQISVPDTAQSTAPAPAGVTPTAPTASGQISVAEPETATTTGGVLRGWVRKGLDLITGNSDGGKLTKPPPVTTTIGRPRHPPVWTYFPGGKMPNMLEVGTQVLASQNAFGWNTGIGTTGNPYSSMSGGGGIGSQVTGLDGVPLWQLQRMASLAPQTQGTQIQYPSYGPTSNPYANQASVFSAFQNRFTPQPSTPAGAATGQTGDLYSRSNQFRRFQLTDGSEVTVNPGEVPINKINAVRSQTLTVPQTAVTNPNSEAVNLISQFAERTGLTFNQAADMLSRSLPD